MLARRGGWSIESCSSCELKSIRNISRNGLMQSGRRIQHWDRNAQRVLLRFNLLDQGFSGGFLHQWLPYQQIFEKRNLTLAEA